MTTSNWKPQPIAPLPTHGTPDDSDIATVIDALRHTPGVYATADIYAYYTATCHSNQRRALAIGRFGAALSRHGLTATRDHTGTRRCWIIQ